MPLYDVLNEKFSVVLDIGVAYTKFGLSGEHAPRCIIRSEVRCRTSGKIRRLIDYTNGEDLYDLLVDFVNLLYFKHALFSPKNKPVIVVEPLLCPTLFRETLAKVLFVHFEISLLWIVPSHLASLATLALDSGLVVDVGYNEAVVIPVCYGVSVLHAWQTLPIGAHALHTNLKQLLSTDNLIIDAIPETNLEDIKVRCCFVTKSSRATQLSQITPPPDVNYPLSGEKTLLVSGKVREKLYELLYNEDVDGQSLATIILDALLKSDMHVRRLIGENIVLIGGTTMAAGFKARLKDELKRNAEQNDKYKVLRSIEFRFHATPSKENYTAWLGGAIYGSTDLLGIEGLTKDAYLKENRLPDWANLRDNIRSI